MWPDGRLSAGQVHQYEQVYQPGCREIHDDRAEPLRKFIFGQLILIRQQNLKPTLQQRIDSRRKVSRDRSAGRTREVQPPRTIRRGSSVIQERLDIFKLSRPKRTSFCRCPGSSARFHSLAFCLHRHSANPFSH